MLNHMNSLHVLEIKPLPDVSLANMFSHIVSFLFILAFLYTDYELSKRETKKTIQFIIATTTKSNQE